MNQQIFKNMALWVVLLVTLVLLLAVVNKNEEAPEERNYSQLTAMLKADQVSAIEIQDGEVLFTSDGKKFHSYIDASFYEAFQADVQAARARNENLSVVMKRKPETSMWQQLLFSMGLPLLLIIGFWVFMARQMQAGGGKAMSFGKSRARLLTENQTKVTFEDVAGVEESKIELEEIIAFLRDPKKFTRLGGRIPKGVLLVGPPGTGKTLLARAVAGEAGVPFFSISGSDFVEMFVGVGASRVRDLFMQGKKHAPCIIFIDEIDAVGRHRGAGLGGGNDEREQTLNQMLVEMDGFETNLGVIVMAATNRPDILDPALLRPGRFDRQVLVDRPDKKGRLDILRVHVRKVKLDVALHLDEVAALTPGFTGADLANLVNEATLAATRRKADLVTLADFTIAVERIVAGLERRNRVLNPEERKTVAYHEMGHALVALALPGSDAVHKVSIIPRGIGALGYTIQRPTEDRYLMTRDELENKIAVLLGGRAAERLVFGHTSTGAADDLAKATDIARAMVMRYGMDEELGHAAYDRERAPFLKARDRLIEPVAFPLGVAWSFVNPAGRLAHGLPQERIAASERNKPRPARPAGAREALFPQRMRASRQTADSSARTT